jgi:hypothetical protein
VVPDRRAGQPVLDPVDRPLECHLVEPPIRIDPDRGEPASAAEATTAGEP